MAQTTTSAEPVHIVRTDGICGGRPCVAGTRIRVQDIYVWHELQGQSPDQIVGTFPQLKLADVYAALAYYWDHRDEILDQMRQEELLVQQASAQFPSKLRKPDAAPDNANAVSS